MVKMKGRSLISVADLSVEEIQTIFDLAKSLKEKLKRGEPTPVLKGKTLAMIFEKPSTRTRISFETGIYQLGGLGLYLSSRDLQLGRGETISDTAKVLSRYCDGIMARTYAHQTVVELASAGTVSVINGLTDLLHPCQALTDFYTIMEWKKPFKGLKFAYFGDGNNMAHSLMLLSAKLGANCWIATPEPYKPDPSITERAMELAEESGGKIKLTDDISAAATDADVIYTDVWASMGQEQEAEKKKMALRPFQVTASLLRLAKDDCIFMHCLPAHRGEEVTAEVIDGKHSVVFQQAENRLHVQKAVMALLMG